MLFVEFGETNEVLLPRLILPHEVRINTSSLEGFVKPFYKVITWSSKNLCRLRLGMFWHLNGAVGSYSYGPPAARSARTKSTGGCYQQNCGPVVDNDSGFFDMLTGGEGGQKFRKFS